MHDEDNAIGLSVKNPAGEQWTAYGDKRALDQENDENKKRCVAALQVSADEIYTAWKGKVKPSKSSYRAWAHAPTLESARGPQTLAPLVLAEHEQRRATIKNRRNHSLTSHWTFPGTAFECLNSGWWNYPITIDGPPGILDGSDVAATATGELKCNVYYQSAQGVIREHVKDGGWKATNSSTFSARMFSPLAAISFDSGKEVCISKSPRPPFNIFNAAVHHELFLINKNARDRTASTASRKRAISRNGVTRPARAAGALVR